MLKRSHIKLSQIKQGAIYDITKYSHVDKISKIVIALGNRSVIQINDIMANERWVIPATFKYWAKFPVNCDGLEGLYPLHIAYVPNSQYQWHSGGGFESQYNNSWGPSVSR